eukprot:CAMPEP_0195060510 /NCGR_PEP_ID=MMETSP0448-20130528/7753_1 /TAXON_ID=66468 /ORGANISM="Heterocapsa triquestra, Strain CCMP 448" /LENGTH=34 /DNA_ID= /DNA_START= /DNA_END= /DNA_ORIENTATION=
MKVMAPGHTPLIESREEDRASGEELTRHAWKSSV